MNVDNYQNYIISQSYFNRRYAIINFCTFRVTCFNFIFITNSQGKHAIITFQGSIFKSKNKLFHDQLIQDNSNLFWPKKKR